MSKTFDVLVVGGGVIGAAVARRLAREKLKVLLLERGRLGREASWAAAGMLTLSNKADLPEPFRRLCAASLAMFPDLAESLRDETGIDVEYARPGVLQLLFDAKDAEEAKEIEGVRKRDGLPVKRLTAREVWALEPAVSKSVRGALLYPEGAQVRNPRFVRALALSALKHGADLREESPIAELLVRGDRVVGVRAGSDRFEAGTTILAAGAWSSTFETALGIKLGIQPARGQILLLEAFPVMLRHLLHSRDEYIVPRNDGKILVGSTVEFVGFNTDTTGEGVHALMRRALQMVPHLGVARFERAWAGLRPHSPDGLPHLGPVPGREGVVVATGHYRNGILLSPATAEIVAAGVLGKKPAFDLDPYRPGR